MLRFVAVIDLGKTNSKVALVDTVLAEELHVIKQPAFPASDSLYPSLDHSRIEAFIIDALCALTKTHSIDAITVTTHGATAALLNASGKLAMPVLDYEFTGVDESRSHYDTYRPPFAHTGSPSLPGGLNIGAQLFWQQANYAEHFAKVSTVLTWPQYWVYRLTGERYNDVTSLGCHTDLYEPEHRRYSTLVHTQGWQALMPATKHSGSLIGSLQRNMAKQLNLPATTPVYTGIHDSNASLVPHLISQSAPFSVVSTGTWFVSLAIGGTHKQLDETKDTLVNVNAEGDPVPSARFMGGRERDLLGATDTVTDQTMDAFLANPHSSAMLMPSVVPKTGPYPDTRHGWVGLVAENAAEHDSRERGCAIALYLALMTQECLLLIGADGPTFVEGPLAKDRQYTQMLAALTDRPVMIGHSDTGTSVGAAMLIRKSDKKIHYTIVDVAAPKRRKLKAYGSRWQRLLTDHLM